MELIELSARLDHGMPREPGFGFTLTSGRVFLGSLNEGGHRLFHGGQGRTRNRRFTFQLYSVFLISFLRWGIYPVEHYPTMLSVLNVGEGKGGILKNMKRA